MGKKNLFVMRWLGLGCASLIVTLVFDFLHIPATILLGAMLAGIIFAVGDSRLYVSKLLFNSSQAVIGCLSSSRIDSSILQTFSTHWLLFLGIVFSTLLVTTAMGILSCRLKLFPGTTAIWGISPGAATAMVVMSTEYGGDPRLVAFMQYVRVIVVALLAMLVARILMPTPASHAEAPLFPLIAQTWFPPLHWKNFGITLLFIAGAGIFGKKSKLPGGCVLVPMILGAILHSFGIIEEIVLPPWFLAISYVILGWNIGLGFTREILRYAIKSLPRVLLLIFLLIAFCGALAWLLTAFLHVDPLTAYLCTSPGGMDTVAIIAASTNVDLPLVMALQSLRLILVVILGPNISHYVAKRMEE